MTEAYNYAMNPPFGAKRSAPSDCPTDGVTLRLRRRRRPRCG